MRHPRRDGEIYLVGTSHVSMKSSKEVEDVITSVKPSHVMVELCERRLHGMKMNSILPPSIESLFERMGLNKNAVEALVRALGFRQGRDMAIAIETAQKTGAQLILGDVAIEETIRALRQAIKPQDLGRIAFSGTSIDTRTMRIGALVWSIAKNASSVQDAAERISEVLMTQDNFEILSSSLEAALPDAYNALVHERDEHMARILLDTVEQKAKGKPVVAVVGYAHRLGLERRFHRLANGGAHKLSSSACSYTLIR